MRRIPGLLIVLLACGLPAPRERPWRTASPGDAWTKLAVTTAWKRVAKQVANGVDLGGGATGPNCLRRLDGYAVRISAFESYRRVEFAPKSSCFVPQTGMGYVFVVQGDRIIEGAIVE